MSLNTVAARLVMQVTPEAVISVAHRLGITSELTNNASIALGTSEVTLLELTSAFVPFANGGTPVEPYLISRITTRSGQILYDRNGNGLGQAITSFDLGALNRNDARGRHRRHRAARAIRRVRNRAARPAPARIIATPGSSAIPAIWSTGVWVGNDDNSPTKKITGGSIPTAIWKDVMEPAHSGLMPVPLAGRSRLSG